VGGGGGGGGLGGGREVSFLRFLINITSISTCLDQNQDMFYKKLLTPYKHLSDMHLGQANTYHLSPHRTHDNPTSRHAHAFFHSTQGCFQTKMAAF
jgi:hypothetical protein